MSGIPKRVFARLEAGDRLWLPGKTGADVPGVAYIQARQRGLFVHFHRSVRDGMDGLEVWMDEEPFDRVAYAKAAGRGLWGDL